MKGFCLFWKIETALMFLLIMAFAFIGFSPDEAYGLDANGVLTTAKTTVPRADTEEFLKIEGMPLEIHAYGDSTMGVFRWEGGTLVRQYYGDYSKSSVIFLNGNDTEYRWGGGKGTFTLWADADDHFTPISHSKPDEWTIQTVCEAGNTGVQVTQTISYRNGDSYYRIIWEVANNGSETHADVRFLHGGDTYFADYDASEGHWDDNLGMVYLTNEEYDVSGIMGLYGGIGYKVAHHYEDHYSSVASAALSGQLPDTVRSDYHDAGYALQWNRGALAPGEAWTIIAFEKWTEAGYLQVIAPADQIMDQGQTATCQFIVQNYQDTEDTFDLGLVSSSGWPVSLPDGSSVTVPAQDSVTVNAQVTPPADAPDDASDTLTLTATSQTDLDITNSDATHVAFQLVVPEGKDIRIEADTMKMVSFVHRFTMGALNDDVHMWEYDPADAVYREYENGQEVKPGKAYWFFAWNSVDIRPQGTPVSKTQNIEVKLEKGWNMIACPNDANYRWDNVRVLQHDDDGTVINGPVPVSSPENHWVEKSLWRQGDGGGYAFYAPESYVIPSELEDELEKYRDDSDPLLKPNEGYWVKVNQENLSLVFPAEDRLSDSGTMMASMTYERTGRSAADSGGPPSPPQVSGPEDGTSNGGTVCFISTAEGDSPTRFNSLAVFIFLSLVITATVIYKKPGFWHGAAPWKPDP